jgi:regulator of RNase E activity RraA
VCPLLAEVSGWCSCGLAWWLRASLGCPVKRQPPGRVLGRAPCGRCGRAIIGDAWLFLAADKSLACFLCDGCRRVVEAP